MSVFNRRNAVVGWITWTVGKRVLRKKARAAKPSIDPESKRPNKSALALVLAGLAGVATFWRARSGDSTED